MFLCQSFDDDIAHISHTNEFMLVILVDFYLHLWLRLLGVSYNSVKVLSYSLVLKAFHEDCSYHSYDGFCDCVALKVQSLCPFNHEYVNYDHYGAYEQ